MQGDIPLRLLLERFGALAADASERAAALQLVGNAAPCAEDLVRLQALDLLTQELADVASALSRTAQAVPKGWAVDADPILKPLRLAGIARRLAGLEGEAPPTAHLELF